MSADKVSLRDVYDIVNKLDEKLERRFVELDRRVDSIESFKNRTLGIISVLAIFTSLAATFVWEKVIGVKQ